MDDGLVSLVDIPVAIAPERLQVEWRAALPAMPAAAARHIEQRWKIYEHEASLAGGLLFNGPVTCLIGVRKESSEGRERVILTLGPGDYKRFLVTCLRDRPWFERHAPEAVAEALGNSVLLTHGDRALLGMRSQGVSAYPGRAHLIGGVAELLGSEKFPARTEGLLEHLKLELHEEAGVDPRHLATDGPLMAGLARDPFLNQPELFWQWETTVELEQIAGRLDPAEHSGAVLIDRHSLAKALSGNLTPVARGAVSVWAQQRGRRF